jgi:hypothetical protein
MTPIWAVLPALLWIASTPLPAQDLKPDPGNLICNDGGSVCVDSSLRNSMVEIPFFFAIHLKTQGEVTVGWELRDDTGQLLDEDPEGRLAFLIASASATERTLGVRDFFLSPAKSGTGRLILHTTVDSVKGDNRTLPELSIPLRIDLRTSDVTYAVPANNDEFANAINDNVESDQAHRQPMSATVAWRKKALLHVRRGMEGGAATEAAARDDSGQSLWHVIDYRKDGATAHLTTLGDGWAGVTYYLTGLDYLLEKTAKHQTGVRHVVFDKPPEFGQWHPIRPYAPAPRSATMPSASPNRSDCIFRKTCFQCTSP